MSFVTTTLLSVCTSASPQINDNYPTLFPFIYWVFCDIYNEMQGNVEMGCADIVEDMSSGRSKWE